jgi:hypothetical protein
MSRPKYHTGQVRVTETLSFSAPLGFREMIDQEAARNGRSRSGHIVWLLSRQFKKLKSPALPPINNQ